MALDFFGVTLSADIQVFAGEEKDEDLGEAGIPFNGPDGEGLKFDLWLDSSSHAGVPAALRNLSYVQDITVELGMGLNSNVQLVLAPPFEEGLVLLSSPLIQWGVGRLNVSFGYTTGTGATQSFQFGGIIQKPDVKIGNDIVITLNALGIGYALKLSEGSQAESYAIDDTPATVVLKVLKNYKSIDLSRIYEDFTEKDKKKETGHKFFRPIFQVGPLGPDKSVIERGPKNDWWFVWEIVRSYGLELLIIDNQFIVKHSERWRGEGRVSKRFRLRAGVDPNPADGGKPIFPILNFSSPTGAVWLATGVGRQVMKDINEAGVDKTVVIAAEKATEDALAVLKKEGDKLETNRKRFSKKERLAKEKELETLEIRIIEQGRVAKENSTYGTTKDNRFRAGPMSAATNHPGNPSTAALDHAKGMFARHNHLKGIHVDVQTIGIPDLRPGDIVKIDGFSVKGQKEGIFDGLYGVIEVRHQVGLGGFMTTFKAISNFYPRQFQLALQAAGVIPKDTSDEADGGKDKIAVEPIGIDSRNASNDFTDRFGNDDDGVF